MDKIQLVYPKLISAPERRSKSYRSIPVHSPKSHNLTKATTKESKDVTLSRSQVYRRWSLLDLQDSLREIQSKSTVASVPVNPRAGTKQFRIPSLKLRYHANCSSDKISNPSEPPVSLTWGTPYSLQPSQMKQEPLTVKKENNQYALVLP